MNLSVLPGCIEVRLSEMEFFPWDNPDSIVDAKFEVYTRKAKNSLFSFLFLLGGPANVINMAVFYKQGLKDRVNLCLFALALADELYISTSIIIHGEHITVPLGDYGPVAIFMTRYNFTFLLGAVFASYTISAVIACERCYCVINPLKSQTLMRTRTMAFILSLIFLTMLSLFFIVTLRYKIGCLHDPVLGVAFRTMVAGPFYANNKELVEFLDSTFFGSGVVGIVMVVMVTATTITTVKLRQIMAWRSETSSSMSSREVGLTKMLIGSSVLFIVCVFPTFLLRMACLFMPEMSAGRRNQNFYFSCLWIADVFININSSTNICVYYKMGSRYRETFWTMFGRRSGQEKKINVQVRRT
ncbi:uncharacterized protein LOC143289687 [Babylonia areolata]|uniref:uncharacterized protein LOC143289687 n=1 Tax=Babylonia areolata TaxID=304850 RepID=UPI003FD675CD